MSDTAFFTSDHHGFYCHQEPFFPSMGEDGNTFLVRLPAHLSDDLDWTQEIELAKQMIAEGKFLLWEIDLGLNTATFNPNDTASFYSYSLALEHFAKTVWPTFQTQTFGLVLYRSSFDPCRHFPISQWEAAFAEWSSARKEDYELFCTQLFSEYLHRLVSFLPESVLPFLWMEIPEKMSAARQAQLLSKDRFEYLHFILRGAKTPFSGICLESNSPHPMCSVGVCLPGDDVINKTVLEQMDALFADLQEKETHFRVVPEEKLTEGWDGLDQLIVFSSALGPRGKRKLLGFIAAGGTVSTVGDAIGLPEEELLSL